MNIKYYKEQAKARAEVEKYWADFGRTQMTREEKVQAITQIISKNYGWGKTFVNRVVVELEEYEAELKNGRE